ncbi:MAG: holo-[acyl-carrier-protein] synthase [Verrucomicrobia bacterium]|nr:holo-[acyl-carrier-protein] synthase [Verrucomicrobiota bacterium]
MIGLGTDLVEIPRIEESITKFGDRFLEKIFLPAEIAYARAQSRPAAHLAARFAAKEAAAKAFGTGIGESLPWLGLEVGRHASGEPFLRFHSSATELARTRGVTRTLVSLSHTRTLSCATVALLGS